MIVRQSEITIDFDNLDALQDGIEVNLMPHFWGIDPHTVDIDIICDDEGLYCEPEIVEITDIMMEHIGMRTVGLFPAVFQLVKKLVENELELARRDEWMAQGGLDDDGA